MEYKNIQDMTEVEIKTQLDHLSKTIHSTASAYDWARFFMLVQIDHPNIVRCEETMMGWFANAMCAAIDENKGKFDKDPAPLNDA